MAYPPPVPTGTRINTTPQVDLHPADHNQIHAALVDIINILGDDPAAGLASLTERLEVWLPFGIPEPWLTDTPPAGHTILDGTTLSRADNPRLFSIWGVTHGAGDGTTTFNKPDMRGRGFFGKTPSSWGDAINERGGSADAVVVTHLHTAGTLSTALESSHYHANNTPNVNVDNVVQAGGGGQAFMLNGAQGLNVFGPYNAGTIGVNPAANNTGSGTPHNHAVTGSTANAGVSGTNANLPPYHIVNWIVRLG